MNSDGTDKHAITTGEQGGGSSPTWSPDGTSIAFSRAGDIWTMDADGDNQAKVADAGSWALSAPEWSPDGQSIAYVQSDQAAGSDRGSSCEAAPISPAPIVSTTSPSRTIPASASGISSSD